MARRAHQIAPLQMTTAEIDLCQTDHGARLSPPVSPLTARRYDSASSSRPIIRSTSPILLRDGGDDYIPICSAALRLIS
jgi:hypothetical protein